jgi:hypothetical protein
MFLWASLITKDLSITPLERIREKVESIPVGMDGLYQQLLDQLGQQPEIAQMAVQIMAWVVYAPRPMTVEELAWACTIKQADKSTESVDSRIINSFRQNIESCGPTLKLDDQGTVKLVHQSAYVFQEF